jgi:hypothetical protein
VIDGGAIYVIGGNSGGTYFNDVYVSTDGGDDRTRAGDRGGTRVVLRGTQGTTGVLAWYNWGNWGY